MGSFGRGVALPGPSAVELANAGGVAGRRADLNYRVGEPGIEDSQTSFYKHSRAIQFHYAEVVQQMGATWPGRAAPIAAQRCGKLLYAVPRRDTSRHWPESTFATGLSAQPNFSLQISLPARIRVDQRPVASTVKLPCSARLFDVLTSLRKAADSD